MRVLVTGFEPFPGAPVNPTEWLVGQLHETPPVIGGVSAFRAEVLPVDYTALPLRLSELGREFSPDIAIHFGLARECRGFRLERIARNRLASARADNSGATPGDGRICEAPDIIATRLPVEAIHAALEAEGLPVEWSDDAGGYLCNMAMTLSLTGACEGFAPTVSGFMHVPDVGEGAPMTEAQLMAGARIVIRETLASSWRTG